MPEAIKCGVPFETFWKLNPKKFKRYSTFFVENYRHQQKEIDMRGWINGEYVLEAIGGAFKPNSYPKQPYLAKSDANGSEKPTEEQIQKERDAFVAKLLVMQANYNMGNKEQE